MQPINAKRGLPAGKPPFDRKESLVGELGLITQTGLIEMTDGLEIAFGHVIRSVAVPHNTFVMFVTLIRVIEFMAESKEVANFVNRGRAGSTL